MTVEPPRADGPRPWLRRPLFGLAAAVAAAAVAFVLYWFQPQALLFDRAVDDDFPAVSADDAGEADADDALSNHAGSDADARAGDAEGGKGAAADGDDVDREDADEDGGGEGSGDTGSAEGQGDDVGADDTTAGPVALRAGSFSGRGRYSGEGTATVYELDDGDRTLRLEDFEVTNGPDLYVWLSAASSDDPDADHEDVFLDLGDLRGNVGDQNYDIPDDVDLDDYQSVIIWCERFSVGFAAADLET